MQIGNAVPVEFARRLAIQVKELLEIQDGKRKFEYAEGSQFEMF